MNTSTETKEIFDALARAQGAMGAASKRSVNPHFKSKYADLAAVLDAAREPLAVNGLALLQDVSRSDGGVQILTRIVHASGQWVEFGPLTIPLTKVDAQGVGSAVSYGRRYAAQSALGQASEDDDGNAISEAPKKAASNETAPAAKSEPVDLADSKKAVEDLKKKLGWTGAK